ncbi:hypothetical protein Pint_10443 [Pistacia integerrima]|uniref:Uncharacterized protein n=1 Tax=Pistacia integerrima TaxID=434235 RepID=A0ACC0XHD4_9ROSI|nr:hypothetical protein Pint_10443 [Pistacia integerrima]
MQAFGFPLGPALCLPRSPPLSRRSHCLDRRVGVDLYMSVLLVRDCNSGVCAVADQGSLSGDEVVHRSDSLLVPDSKVIT